MKTMLNLEPVWAQEPNLDPLVRKGFASALENLSELEALKLNPLRLARQTGIDPDTVVRLCIRAVKAGLFGFEWNLLCPLCGGREHSYRSLNQIDRQKYHCSFCDRTIEVVADELLEVAFSIKSGDSRAEEDRFRSLADYLAFHSTPDFCWSQEMSEIFQAQPAIHYRALPPGRKLQVNCGLPRIGRYRIASLETHSICNLRFVPPFSKPEETRQLEIGPEGFLTSELSVNSTTARLSIHNLGTRTIGILIAAPDSEAISRVIKKHPPHFAPFLTGRMVLNNQDFRDFLLADNLPDDLALKINDLSILFTDLKGSTSLYDRTGDVVAYRLVRDHFAGLRTIVRQYRGGIVKTMGDAIMASFNTPEDGLRAALAMQSEVERFNRSLDDRQNALGLKVGLHRGPVIAVKANQTLDYFGQTVNIAARVQGLAKAGQVWLSDQVMGRVGELIRESGVRTSSAQVALKGLGEPVLVHCLEVAGGDQG